MYLNVSQCIYVTGLLHENMAKLYMSTLYGKYFLFIKAIKIAKNIEYIQKFIKKRLFFKKSDAVEI